MNRGDGANDREDPFLFRSQNQAALSNGLEEELSAAILRIAKEKFRGRDLKASPEPEEPVSEVIKSIEDNEEGSPMRIIKASSSADESGSGDEPMDESDMPSGSRRGRQRQHSPTFQPVVSADDDLSYDLLRPAARNIIEKLETTLTILHNARVAGVTYLSDSPESDGDHGDAASRPRKRRRSDDAHSQRKERKPIPVRERRVGRPRIIHVPREGETEQQMRVRVAREQKVRLPTFSDEGEDSDEEKPRKPNRVRQRKSKSREPSMGPTHGHFKVRDREKKLSLWGLRDWSDVVGAAAMAGFSPEVIKRATQRCSNLFHQQMEIRTLVEEADGSREQTTTYAPGNPVASLSEEEPTVVSDMDQIRSLSRQPSVGPGAAVSDEEEEPKPRRIYQRRGSRRRRRRSPTVSTADMSFCPHRGCSRAVEGFTRRLNLARHIQLVHGEGQPVPTDDENSSGDMDGGVHVDGFLKPIKARRGWRGVDTSKRIRNRTGGRRGRSVGLSDDGYGAESSDGFLKAEPEDPWL